MTQTRMPPPRDLATTRPGRPRSEAAREAVLTATWRLLAAHNLDKISVTEIARHSGVSKPTIYKWWSSKAALAADAFFSFASLESPCPRGRSAATRLKNQINSLVSFYDGDAGRIVRDIIAHGPSDPDTLRSFRRDYLEKRRAQGGLILQHGIDRGEFAEGLNVETALDMLYGPIYYRLLVEHAPLDQSFAASLVAYVLAAISHRS